ncbi:MAG: DUF2780 domain-containing protein [Methylomonas sp.]|nr:DUF2780 domain-containing protein [Methylomonas sp.]PPD19927.1 MAG: hypothetical protein CTY23_10435 [Methylomonas sp.]PPD25476.1 MAG: hypothetical protein CTY22_08510 [Methylomonas sp.]PPD36176.1 MAG: hypothetical protein CTY21_08515 [Methylomonas sp.]PPD39713.1 MAG: hypothetical protein CTY17_07695 [Methylomonas sp.]
MKSPIIITGIALTLTGCMAPSPHTGQIFTGGAVNPAATLPQVAAATPVVDAVSNAVQLSLVNTLASQLGITPQQAMGGAGAIFQVAQQRIPANDFSTLSNAIPGMNQYLAAVPRAAAPNNAMGLLGAAAGLAGGQAGGLMGLASLVTSFNALGLNAQMINQFVPMMLQHVQQQSGQAAMMMLQAALQ